MPLYQVTPQDVLMFRDGRPMEANAGSGGHGARWPEPSIIFDALHAALHLAFPEQQSWERKHRFGRSSDRDFNRGGTQRFGSLATAGPFPVRGGEWFFPAPQDVTLPDRYAPCLLPMDGDCGFSDLPPKLRALGSVVVVSKKTARPWWNKQAIECYLNGGDPAGFPKATTRADDALFLREWTTGIAITPETQTAAESQIYSAEYLRLREDVALGIDVQMPMKAAGTEELEETITHLFPGNQTITIGGQQRACHVAPAPDSSSLAGVLPVSQKIDGHHVKWLLLTPAVFPGQTAREIRRPDGGTTNVNAHPGGWLPNWIDPATGRVLLKSGDNRRKPRESRAEWRARVRDEKPLDCKLVAARIPKLLVLSGWSERLHLRDDLSETDAARKKKGARPTLLAVPAGAIYYFEGKDASQLADALAWHGADGANADRIHNRRSTLMGEKGFGLGVCGPWDYSAKSSAIQATAQPVNFTNQEP